MDKSKCFLLVFVLVIGKVSTINEFCVPKESYANGNATADVLMITTKTITEEKEENPEWRKKSAEQDVNAVEKPYTFPWSVALFAVYYMFDLQFEIFVCGGTLIDDQVVMTSAACVLQHNRSSLNVHIGRLDISRSREAFMQKIQIKDVKVHDNYDPTIHQDSIALVFLSEPARIGPTSNRVCLTGERTLESNLTCYVTGWSHAPAKIGSNRLLNIEVDLVSRDECIASRSLSSVNTILRKDILCANYSSGLYCGIGCEHALGSGMVCTSHDESEHLFLVGIASRNVNMRAKNRTQYPHVFLLISSYMSWIDDQMRAINPNISLIEQ